MVGWQRHIQSLFRHVGKRVEYNYNQSANLYSSHLESFLTPG